MLTASELAAMRSTLTESLPDTAQVQRKTRVSDGMGGFTETWEVVATVACRVSPSGLSSQERAVAERLGSSRVWTITLPAQTGVQTPDRITVGSRSFEVAGIGNRSDEICRRVICVEVF